MAAVYCYCEHTSQTNSKHQPSLYKYSMEAEDQTFTDTKLVDKQMGHVGAIT
jgi:hypothetical protein